MKNKTKKLPSVDHRRRHHQHHARATWQSHDAHGHDWLKEKCKNKSTEGVGVWGGEYRETQTKYFEMMTTYQPNKNTNENVRAQLQKKVNKCINYV